jgi:hypothetical protein
MGDFSHLKNKKGEFIQQPLPQPTLPNISIDDDLADIASLQKRAGTPTTTYSGTGESRYGTDAKVSYDYPTMPAYNAPYSHLQDPMTYARYNPSVPTLADEGQYHEDDYGSTANFVLDAEPYGQGDRDHPAPYHGSQGYAADPYDIYTGYATNDQFDRTGTASQGNIHTMRQMMSAWLMGHISIRTGTINGHPLPIPWYDDGQFHGV